MSAQKDGRPLISFTPWSKGRPPRGWHFASADRDPERLRYWDGSVWSASVHESVPGADLERARRTPDREASPRFVWWRSLTAESRAWLAAEGAPWHGEEGMPASRSGETPAPRPASLPTAEPIDRIVWRQELQQVLGVSLESISRYLRTPGKLPPPDLNLSAKKVGWKVSTLHAAGLKLPL